MRRGARRAPPRLRKRSERHAERDQATRERLLEVATRLFAERGFSKVTVREICREARANLAAVNYHFADKLGLYEEVVHAVILDVRRRSDVTMQAPEGSAAEEKLRHYVRAQLQLIAGPDERPSDAQKLLTHEMADPTPAFELIFDQAIMPRVRYLRDIVAELLGCPNTDPRVRHCVISIQSHYFFYTPNPIRARVFPNEDLGTPAWIEETANHITEFSLAGIRAIAQSPRDGTKT